MSDEMSFWVWAWAAVVVLAGGLAWHSRAMLLTAAAFGARAMFVQEEASAV